MAVAVIDRIPLSSLQHPVKQHAAVHELTDSLLHNLGHGDHCHLLIHTLHCPQLIQKEDRIREEDGHSFHALRAVSELWQLFQGYDHCHRFVRAAVLDSLLSGNKEHS